MGLGTGKHLEIRDTQVVVLQDQTAVLATDRECPGRPEAHLRLY